ncbi:LysR family transcriptional regulator [Psychrobacillus sp. NPDC093180]|uniref:LysR family transcriptional regulator n=1 Tax=Psychrobacillus sp. NPDC093180 TaxID=3364489 RepID=UPI0037FDE78E
MDEKDWLILKELYSKGSITKASESLYISQPALTKRIQQIENSFNVKIISRSSKGIQFTLEGEYLVKYAGEMLSTLQKTKDIIVNMASNTVEGNLKIGVSINFSYNNLPLLIKLFSARFPNIKTHITTGYSSEIVTLFQEKKLQVAIARGEFNWAGPKRHIDTENICIISKDKIDINSLNKYPRIEYKTDTLFKRQLDNWWNEIYDTPPVVAMEVDNSQTCIEMISQGLGYGILPRYCVGKRKDLHLENIHNSNGQMLVRDTWIIYRDKELELTPVKKFITFMEETIDSGELV